MDDETHRGDENNKVSQSQVLAPLKGNLLGSKRLKKDFGEYSSRASMNIYQGST